MPTNKQIVVLTMATVTQEISGSVLSVLLSLRIAMKIVNLVEVILGESFRSRVNHSINFITASGNILVA